jgi:hypothetical protein
VIIGGSDIFVEDFFLFGATDLIAGQDGYSESFILKRRLEEWPARLVVIGSDGGDPYVLDLSRINGEDAPVLTAWHGQGSWDFHPVAAPSWSSSRCWWRSDPDGRHPRSGEGTHRIRA